MNTKTKATIAIIAIGALPLIGITAGYHLGARDAEIKIAKNDQVWMEECESIRHENDSARNELANEIDNLTFEIKKLKVEAARYEGSAYEDHSDWLDCHAALTYINLHLDEIDRIDTTNPVPVIYMKDGRIMSPNSAHRVAEAKAPPTTEPVFQPSLEMGKPL